MAELPLPTGFGVPAATSRAVPLLPAWGRLLSLGGRRGAHTSEQAGRQQQQQAGLCWILFAGSGNLTEDMESQLQANNIRIEVLERENAQLKALLAKVKVAAEQGVLKVSWVPQGGCCVPQNHPMAPRHSLGTPAEPGAGSSCCWEVALV